MHARMASVVVIVAISAAVASAWLVKVNRDQLVWDHFDVVKPGILYRSGQLTPAQLEAAVRTYGIKTVVSLQNLTPGVEAERVLVKRLGVGFLRLPMPGDGFGREEQFREVLKAVDDPKRRPVLVHCARGTCRTGAAVALYRFERDGWTIDDVSAEMDRQVYRDGWLPGYVYAMVEQRPFYTLDSDLKPVVDAVDSNPSASAVDAAAAPPAPPVPTSTELPQLPPVPTSDSEESKDVR